MTEIFGRQIIDTGPFPAQRWGRSDPLDREKVWPTDGILKIWMCQVWMGMDIGGRGDFWFSLYRKSDGNLLAATNWDHYADPTGPHAVTMTYSPHSIDIAPKDSLVLHYGARRWNPLWPPVQRGHLTVTIWTSEG